MYKQRSIDVNESNKFPNHFLSSNMISELNISYSKKFFDLEILFERKTERSEKIIVKTQSSKSGEVVMGSPYYFHSSGNQGTAISPVLLNGENYVEWAREMEYSLRAKKFSFMTRTWCLAPTTSPHGVFPSLGLLTNMDYFFWKKPLEENPQRDEDMYPWIMWFFLESSG